MTGKTRNGEVRMFVRNGRYFVFYRGELIDRTTRPEWAVYRFVCAGAIGGAGHRALVAHETRRVHQ